MQFSPALRCFRPVEQLHVGIRPREHLELSAIHPIAALVARGLGVSLVPDWASPRPVERLVAKLSLPDQTHVLNVGLLSTSMSSNAQLARLLRDEARTVLRPREPATGLPHGSSVRSTEPGVR